MKTIINGKEIKLVTRNDVSKIVSSKVAEMLTQGFTLYFYGGSQGEEGKVCLTNDDGKTVYIFWVHKEYETLGEKSWNRGEALYITGEKFEKVYPGKTLWFGKGEKFFEQKWFKIEDCNKERFVETLEDWQTIDDIRSERLHAYRYSYDNQEKLSENVNKIALKVIKKRKGYKTISLKDVASVYHRIGYGYIFNFTKESGKQNFSISMNK